MSSKSKFVRRQRIKRRVRSVVSGTEQRPRLTVFRSLSHIYAQLIDDVNGHTLVAASSMPSKGASLLKGKKSDVSREVGKALAEKAKAKGIDAVVFDRNGYRYHGRVKALAEGAREGGLKF
ncbi:ribosomal protein L18 [Chloroherpeton thalassium ATCC 35110]|uniref:Large ribosomal subunit protein uL18 n=1 Tax=Chloroherpeton thalassium (strain ATCC 35110 / GB-78) TaxID=517418 RepID=RL18_CHLT3|nr:50S ribosomal protein L18 [Chloroherpeton thalassium]B3QYE0.1 RecName: Full=Large ribosomal subunit protein uL18; AltName: Full=50S ribosomal protein L18 [Chloroherpeton thalassium ATCC 35110]ACF13568.1 ribosomal protein L18 [Chloroherpeton thalassium ATCC 35110]